MFYYCIVRVLCPQENGNNKKMKNKQTFIRPALLLTTLLLLTAAPAEARKKENRKSGKTENIAEKTDSTRNNRKKYLTPAEIILEELERENRSASAGSSVSQ